MFPLIWVGRLEDVKWCIAQGSLCKAKVRMLRASLRNFLALLLLPAVCGLHAYGHAYSRPDDFTPAQYAEIVKRFTVFTVEKDHAASVYGNASAEKPYRTNSIASSVGTARNIKKYAYHLNASIKVSR